MLDSPENIPNPEHKEKSSQELNVEFKNVVALFPPPLNIPMFQTFMDDDGKEFMDTNPEGLERYGNRQDGELKEALFDKLTELGSAMNLTPSGRADLLQNLETNFMIGIPNPELPIEERVLRAGRASLARYLDAKNPESGGIFDHRLGRRIDIESYNRFSSSLDRRKKRGRDIKPEELSKQARWEKDLYGKWKALSKVGQLLHRK